MNRPTEEISTTENGITVATPLPVTSPAPDTTIPFVPSTTANLIFETTTFNDPTTQFQTTPPEILDTTQSNPLTTYFTNLFFETTTFFPSDPDTTIPFIADTTTNPFFETTTFNEPTIPFQSTPEPLDTTQSNPDTTTPFIPPPKTNPFFETTTFDDVTIPFESMPETLDATQSNPLVTNPFFQTTTFDSQTLKTPYQETTTNPYPLTTQPATIFETTIWATTTEDPLLTQRYKLQLCSSVVY